MSSRRSSRRHLAVLEGLRALSAASDLLDSAVAEHLHMHRTDLRCLDYLARFGPVPAGRLAEAVGLSTGALTIAVDRLERAGYVRRRADSTDRRRVLVDLANDANRVVALFGDLARATDRMLNVYTETELQLLGAFLNAASEVLSAQAITISKRSPPRKGIGST
jgi:DNA-binding MarR family transcriptional regulator